MLNRTFLILLLLIAVLVGEVSLAQPPVDTRCMVTVACQDADQIEGVALRVLAPASSGGMLGLTPISGKFNAKGECTVRVPRGRFCFEVLYLTSDATMVAMKSKLLTIMKDQTVTLVALPAQEITMEIEGEGRVPLTECAIRFDSAIGEIVWKVHDHGGSPMVVACADQKYRVRLIGQQDELHAAIWKQVDGESWNVLLKQREVSIGSFEILDDGPEVDWASAVFSFPDARLDIDVSEETRMITNRRFLSYGYQLTTKQGQSIVAQPQLGLIPRRTTYEIGGAYRPVAWLNVMKAKQLDKTTTHFTWGADLVDSNGYLVDTKRSQIDWKMTGRTPAGEIKQDITIPDDQVKLYSDPQRALRVDLTYDLGQGKVAGTLIPVTFRPYSISGFKTSAPPHWQLQALNYLAKARRVYGCIEEVEGKSGEHTTEIRWHKASGIAWGTVGGKSAWIMMPFAQLQDGFDHFATPWALPHEMLHNFKYNHGDAMNAANKATIHKLELFRWYMVDRPELSPGDALPQFRAFQRGAPLDVK